MLIYTASNLSPCQGLLIILHFIDNDKVLRINNTLKSFHIFIQKKSSQHFSDFQFEFRMQINATFKPERLKRCLMYLECFLCVAIFRARRTETNI